MHGAERRHGDPKAVADGLGRREDGNVGDRGRGAIATYPVGGPRGFGVAGRQASLNLKSTMDEKPSYQLSVGYAAAPVTPWAFHSAASPFQQTAVPLIERNRSAGLSHGLLTGPRAQPGQGKRTRGRTGGPRGGMTQHMMRAALTTNAGTRERRGSSQGGQGRSHP